MPNWNPEDAVAYYLANHDLKIVDEMPDDRHPATALRFIAEYCTHAVLDNLHRFRLLDARVALRLIDLGYPRQVIDSLGRFSGLNEEVALRLVALGFAKEFELNVGSFGRLGFRTAEALITIGDVEVVPRLVNYLTGLDHDALAQRLLQKGCGATLAARLSSFRHLGADTGRLMIELGHGKSVAESLNSFLYDDRLVSQLVDLGLLREFGR